MSKRSGRDAKRWYFMVATSDECGFRSDMVIVDAEQREQMRVEVMAELVQRPPLVIHDIGDEVEMVRLCEVLWPGPCIATLRKEVEADYAKRVPREEGARPPPPHFSPVGLGSRTRRR